jgi:hypothetical protein
LHILKLAVLVALVTIAAPVVFAADILGPSAGCRQVADAVKNITGDMASLDHSF